MIEPERIAGDLQLRDQEHSRRASVSEPAVSRRHAQLRFRDGRWIVQDLGSRNGSFLNGTPIGRSELRPGDVLALGGERLRVD